MKRDALFDNARLGLIVLVVVGHAIEPLIGIRGLKGLYLFIYLFHMPAMVLVSGYFAKSLPARDRFADIVRKILIPYAVFQTLYSVFVGQGVSLSVPYWVMWFLLSLFCWHLLLPFFAQLRYGLVWAVGLAVLAGYAPNVAYPLSLSRTAAFFPFFLAGYHLQRGQLRVSTTRKVMAAGALAALLVVAYWVAQDVNPQWLYQSLPYVSLKHPEWYAGLYRLGLLALSFGATICVLWLVPEREGFWTPLGSRTLAPYLLHGFVLRWPGLVKIYTYFPSTLSAAPLVLGAVAMTLMLSTKPVSLLISPLLDPGPWLGWLWATAGRCTSHMKVWLQRPLTGWVISLLLSAAVVVSLVIKQVDAVNQLGLDRGPRFVISTVSTTLLVVSAVIGLKGRWKVLGLLSVDALLSFAIYADVLYYRQFRDFTSVASLRYSGQLVAFSEGIRPLLKVDDLSLFADLLVLLLILLVPIKWTKPFLVGAGRKVVAAVAVLSLGVTVWAAPPSVLQGSKWGGHPFIAKNVGLLTYHGFDLANFSSNRLKGLESPKTYVAEAQAWQTDNPHPDVATEGLAAGKNLIMVQVEALQQYVIGRSVGGQEITPNLNRLLRESMYFPDFYNQIGQGSTSDAEFLVQCSLYPLSQGSVYFDFAQNSFRCLPTLLAEAGYDVAAYHGARPTYWNRRMVYPSIGFEKFVSEGDFEPGIRFGYGLSDFPFLDQTATLLEKTKEPFYSFVITVSSHTPFDWKPIPHELDVGILEGTFPGNYLQAIHYADKALGAFVERLRQDGLLDRSVLVLYGDHHAMTTQQQLEQALPEFSTSQLDLFYATNRVPLMIRVPDAALQGTRSRTAGEIDVAPTVLSLLGVKPDASFLMGHNMLSDAAGAFVSLHNGSFITSDLAYNSVTGICWRRSTAAPIAPDACAEVQRTAAEARRISEEVITRNLIPQVVAP